MLHCSDHALLKIEWEIFLVLVTLIGACGATISVRSFLLRVVRGPIWADKCFCLKQYGIWMLFLSISGTNNGGLRYLKGDNNESAIRATQGVLQ